MRLILLCLLTFLAACNTAGPGFMGIAPIKQKVDGSSFLIRLNGPRAEVIRTNPEVLPKPDVIATKAARAVQGVTGCNVAWVVGDVAKMLMGLSCNGAPAPKKPRRKKGFVCDINDYYRIGDYVELDLDCVIYDRGFYQ